MKENRLFERIEQIVIWLVVIGGMLLCFCSCAPRIKYIERVTHDSVYINKVYTDSVYYRDSIYVDKTGDTVYKTVIKWRERKIGGHDTIYVNKSDSIPYPVEVERIVKKSNGFTTGCTIGFFVTWIMLLLVVVLYIVRRYAYNKK